MKRPMVVIWGDGDPLTSACNIVARQMLPVRTGLNERDKIFDITNERDKIFDITNERGWN
jgi:hypothetical protein